MRPSIKKYLDVYAEDLGPWASFLERNADLPVSDSYDFGVLIPSRSEEHHLLATLESLEQAAAQASVLVVIVINGSANERASNERTLVALRSWAEACLPVNLPVLKRGPLTLMIHSMNDLEPGRSHVGLARKWAADFLLRLYAQGSLRSAYFRSLDADTLVSIPCQQTAKPATSDGLYFLDPRETDSPIHRATPISAFTYRIKHQRAEDAETQSAMDDYEFYLHYYQAGLRFAGSPYAHQSIGSAFAFHAESYAQVRGFPCREAGEDFYLLNKLRKVGLIVESAATVSPAARLSRRVPFGTGPALSKILHERREGRPYTLYHPGSFKRLKLVLEALQKWAQVATPEVPSLPFLSALEVARLHTSLRGRFNPVDRQKTLDDAFDGLKTLRFIRGCQKELPPQPLDLTRDLARDFLTHRSYAPGA